MKSEKRLIDANAIKYRMISHGGWGPPEYVADEGGIDKMPTVDAVEVVRCKDCKHYKFRKPYPSYNATVKTCCRCANTRVNDDDFCSYGERREGE